MTEGNEMEYKIPRGQIIAKWATFGMAIFSGFGVALSVLLDNPGYIGIGVALGLVLGAGYGHSIEKSYVLEGKIRPLTEQDIDQKKRRGKSAWVVFMLGILIFVIVLLSAKSVLGQQTNNPFTSKMADLGEIQMQYMDFGGEGIPFIWVQDFHNYFEGSYYDTTYFPYLKNLTKYARVLAPLRRGYGKSTDTQWGYDVATQAEDLLRFMDALGIEKAILFGRLPANQDMTWIAEHHPERLAGLVYWGNPILIVGCGYPDELLLMENWSAFAPDFEKEKEKRVVMSRAFWRPHFLDDTTSHINVPALRILNTAFGEMSVIRGISEPDRMEMWISKEGPGYEAELAALKSLAEDSVRYVQLREHLRECDPSENLDKGIERSFGTFLQTVERPCLYESEEAAKAQLDWIFEQIALFLQKH